MEPVPSPLLILATGAAVGFLGGLLGKGGSAIATPVLAALGVPPMIAVAAPLPATVPGTLVAADRYRRHDLIDRSILKWALLAGFPATILGAALTRWIDGSSLVLATDAIILLLGLRLLLHPADAARTTPDIGAGELRRRTVAVAGITGLAAGLLANSGGFLLAPLFITVLRVPVKAALGTSLAVAAALAVPGTVIHLGLGHLDWGVVALFGLGSIPLSGIGARVALRIDSRRLERGYGVVLVLLGAGFLLGSLL